MPNEYQTEKYVKEKYDTVKKGFTETIAGLARIHKDSVKYSKMLFFSSLLMIIFLVFSVILISVYVLKYKTDTKDLVKRYDVTIKDRDKCVNTNEVLTKDLEDFKKQLCLGEDWSQKLIKSVDFLDRKIGSFKIFDRTQIGNLYVIRFYNDLKFDLAKESVSTPEETNTNLIQNSNLKDVIYYTQDQKSFIADKTFSLVNYDFINDRVYFYDSNENVVKGYEAIITPDPGYKFSYLRSYKVKEEVFVTGIGCDLDLCTVYTDIEGLCSYDLNLVNGTFSETICNLPAEDMEIPLEILPVNSSPSE